MKNKIIKIIYFDENSAIDYINIIDGGKVESETTKVNETDKSVKLSIGAKIAANLKLLNLFKSEVGIDSSIELDDQSKGIVKSTITNTIITDFISKVDDTSMIKEFSNANITILSDSFTYLKLYTPYTYVISESSVINKDIAVNRLDDVMEKIKGYYEVLATIEDKKYVLRFNIKCFKNNYKLADLLKMDLSYYGIMVGQTSLDKLSSLNELNINDKLENISAEKIVNKIDNKEEQKLKNVEFEIYDIILAGVKYSDRK